MGKPMRIAQIAPLYEAVPPKLYGGTERVVSNLTEALVADGHDVTLFASGDSETSGNLARPASRCGTFSLETFSLEIRCDLPIRRVCATAVMPEPAVGGVSVTPRKRLRAATSGLRIIAADGAAARIGQPIARPSRSHAATVSRTRPRTVGNGSSLAPIARARVTASGPRRGTRTARDTKVRATRAARAIHGQSGCRSRRRCLQKRRSGPVHPPSRIRRPQRC